MLNLAISPFDLTTRSRSAALSLLLADTVCTLSPADLGEADEPNADFASQWSWTRDLWHEGILDPAMGHAFAEHARRAWERVGGGALLETARRGAKITAALPATLDATRLIRSLARTGTGGADPSVRIAVEAAIMRAGAEHHTAVARDAGDALLDRLIERSTQPMARLTLPIPDALDEDVIIQMRRLLATPLAPVRQAIAEVIAAGYAGADAPRVREVCDRRVAPLAETLVREAVSIETALDGASRMTGIRAVAVRIGRVSSDLVTRAAEAAAKGKTDTPDAALAAEGRTAIVLSVKPLAWDAASI